MTLDEIVIPISINTSNESKLDEISNALKNIAYEEFENLKDLKSKLEHATKSGVGFNTVYNALLANTEKSSKNFKNLANSIKGVGDKSSNIKSLSSTLKGVGKSLFDVKAFSNKAAQALDQLAVSALPITLVIKVVERIGSAITGVFTGALDSLASFNEEVSVFSDMLGDTEVGKVLADDIRAFGEETLFTGEAISNAAKTMLSYGAAASEVSERMRMFGEAAGGSSAGLEKLAEVYSKVEAGNNIALEDLSELRNVGVDITDILAKEAEDAGSSLFKMASDGKLGFNELSNALKKATSEGGKFYGNTARGAKTLAEAQLQTSKMSQKLFLELGKALEPMMIGFEKLKQALLLGIVVPITKVASATIFLFNKYVEFYKYMGGTVVSGFKLWFNTLMIGFNKIKELVSYVIGTLTLGFKLLFNTMMTGFRKAKEWIHSSILTPLSNISESVMDLLGKLKSLVSYVTIKFVSGFKIALDPIIEMFKKLTNWVTNLWDKMKGFWGVSKDSEQKTNTSLSSDEGGKKDAPDRVKSLNENLIKDYKALQEQIFIRQREVALKPLKEQEKATRDLQATINAKNKEFIKRYGKSFNSLTAENQKTLANVEKEVNTFAKSNFSFVNAHKDLQNEIAKLSRAILVLPYEEQEKAMKTLANDINKKKEEFVSKYLKSFDTLNDSNKNLLTALQKGVNEFGKTATDRAFVDAHKALQKKVMSMEFEVMMRPLKEREKATADMQSKIRKLYDDFVESHKREFDKLSEANQNALLRLMNNVENAIENVGHSWAQLSDKIADMTEQVFTQDLGRDLGKTFVLDKFYDAVMRGLDSLIRGFYELSKSLISSIPYVGKHIVAYMNFIEGIFQGIVDGLVKKIEAKRDKDLDELVKQSEVELLRIEKVFDREIEMRRDKLNELDDQYSREIEFLKQAQSKGQISGEEFQRRIAQVESEYKSKRQQESGALTKAETSKKIEVERARKLEKLEAERIKAAAEVEKVKARWWHFGRSADIEDAQKILEEILRRIARVKSAGSVEEIKLARKGAIFKTTRPTYMPGLRLMTSEMGQSELIRVTPAPIDENLRNIEARIIAEEINKIQQSERKSPVIINNYNFNGDVLDADKLVRMLKAREHSIGFRMSE